MYRNARHSNVSQRKLLTLLGPSLATAEHTQSPRKAEPLASSSGSHGVLPQGQTAEALLEKELGARESEKK